MSRPGSLLWFARHELRLAWRDWLFMMTAGGRRGARGVAIGVVLFALFMHVIAWFVVGPYARLGGAPDPTVLVIVTAGAVLSWSAMASQALESVTRAFYARADLDLILASPAATRRIFAVRIGAMALSVSLMAALLAAPVIDVLALRGGGLWLGAYGVVWAMGCTAVALAVALAAALFRLIGPRRTRLIAQVVAAVIGAAFVIGLQAAAILSSGTLSRLALLQSPAVMSRLPAPDSPLWWPARAILGEPVALAAVLGASLLSLAAAIVLLAPRFARYAVAAASVAAAAPKRRRRRAGFRRGSPARALRRKEWTLLRRDPWLLSQTLMQLLYLLPPALLLWRSFGDGGGGAVALLVPVLIMAAGQLAGGLAWLAISGEDAPDLVATAPVRFSRVLRAKTEAVMSGVALVFLPFIAAIALVSPRDALVTSLGIAAAAIAAAAIQLWFRSQARRSHFRRRQTSSRIATFAEAFSSVAWAGAGALAAAGTGLWVIAGLVALAILGMARLASPARLEEAAAPQPPLRVSV
ncbi:MAG: hypothetical protein ACLQJR_27225 [Stellaceae bacterium]